MTESKFIDVFTHIYKPGRGLYELSISNQSHVESEFGEHGSNKWAFNGFVLISSIYPAFSVEENTFFVRGDNPDHDNAKLNLDANYNPKYANLYKSYISKLFEAVKAYNNTFRICRIKVN